MTSRVRYSLIILAAIGLAASVASLYVHYRLLTDPTYASFCDISESVSCQQVFQSEYGTVFGLPVAIGGAVWSGLVLLLSAWGMRQPRSESASRVAGYIFLLSIAGLAAVFYFAYASFFVLRQACPLCMTMYASVIGIFLVSASAAGKLSALPSRFGQDLAGVGQNTTAATLAGIWVVASLALVLTFPREQAVSAAEAAPDEPAAPMETLTPEQQAEWHQWFDAQKPVAEAMPADPAVKVLVMKFNDYQCPACRATWSLYRDIIAKYEAAYPEVFKYETRDFPLEAECGAGGGHGAACEAAAAVRMARDKGRHKELEATLYARQSPGMTGDEVKEALQEVAQISPSEFDARYQETLQAVRADAQLGQRLGVQGTPTFFVNGVLVPTVRPAYFAESIEYALRKAGVAE